MIIYLCLPLWTCRVLFHYFLFFLVHRLKGVSFCFVFKFSILHFFSKDFPQISSTNKKIPSAPDTHHYHILIISIIIIILRTQGKLRIGIINGMFYYPQESYADKNPPPPTPTHCAFFVGIFLRKSLKEFWFLSSARSSP